MVMSEASSCNNFTPTALRCLRAAGADEAFEDRRSTVILANGKVDLAMVPYRHHIGDDQPGEAVRGADVMTRRPCRQR